MVLSTLILHSARPFSGNPNPTSVTPEPDLSRSWSAAPPEPELPASNSLEAPWLNPREQTCSEQVHQVLLGSRKPSTRATYLSKQLCVWAFQCGVSPTWSSLQEILEYQGFAVSFVKVHRAAVLAFHLWVDNWSIFSNNMSVQYLKGLESLYLHGNLPTCLLPEATCKYRGTTSSLIER